MIFKPQASPKIYFTKNPPAYSVGQCDCGDCDCACAEPAFSQAKSVADAQQWEKAERILFSPIDDQHCLAFNMEQPARPAALNQAARAMLSSVQSPFSRKDFYAAWSALPRSAVDSAFSAFAQLRLIKPTGRAATPAALLQETQTLLVAWMHLTDRCNLRCAYCYLPHRPADMSLETGYAAVAAIFRSALAHGYRKIKIKYAGGEPLLRLDVLLALHKRAKERAALHGLGIEGIVLSNGTLLDDEKAKTLKANGLRLMISLDGIGAYHNAHRSDGGGQGSFEKAARAVETALRQGIALDISVTISEQNAAGLGDLMKWILERDLPFSLNFFRANALASPSLGLEEEMIIKGMNQAFDAIEENLPRRSILPSLLDRVNLSAPHRRTCGVGANYMVFAPNGDIAKCQMQINRAAASVNAPDPLAAIRSDRDGIQNLDVDAKEECRSCAWRYWCTGGCPLETFRVTGSYSAKSPNCNIYKSLFPRALRLEGLRLLAYESGEDFPAQ